MKKTIKYILKDFYFALRGLLHKGKIYYCPICDKTFNSMYPHVGHYFIKGVSVDHYTSDAHCPTCNLDIRHRLFYYYFKEEINNKELSILHFAPEYKIYKILKTKSLKKYVVADLNPDLYAEARPIDATKIPFDDSSFEIVIFNHILQFIKDDLKAIQEISRVLKKGGKLYLTIPIYPDETISGTSLTAEEREKQFGAPNHLHMYGMDILQKIKDLGLNVEVKDLYELNAPIYNKEMKSPHSDSDRYLFVIQKI